MSLPPDLQFYFMHFMESVFLLITHYSSLITRPFLG